MLGDSPGRDLGIDGDGHAGTLRQSRQADQLGPADDVVRNEDVAVDAGSDHDLGFAELLAANADSAGTELHVGDLRDLVGLDMDHQVDAGVATDLLHPVDVLFEDIEVDDHGGRIDVVDGVDIALTGDGGGSTGCREAGGWKEARGPQAGAAADAFAEIGSEVFHGLCPRVDGLRDTGCYGPHGTRSPGAEANETAGWADGFDSRPGSGHR